MFRLRYCSLCFLLFHGVVIDEMMTAQIPYRLLGGELRLKDIENGYKVG